LTCPFGVPLPDKQNRDMSQAPPTPVLPWLEPGQAFPHVESAWTIDDPAPGLLAAGGVLDIPTLISAYSQGIFPWYSAGQPILWWSTNPRMVLPTHAFRLHRSLRKSIQKLLVEERLEIRVDDSFERVIQACAHTPRDGQQGTWILPAIMKAYVQLHRAGKAHSVETWIDGELVGGLYGVNLGRMMFGESMFSRQANASKIALAALVAFCREHDMSMIDCQQDTSHLASLGAQLIERKRFSQHLRIAVDQTAPSWKFLPVYWRHLLGEPPDRA
jgi:leucyl/phenylalanyl-tRNA---protein transferase